MLATLLVLFGVWVLAVFRWFGGSTSESSQPFRLVRFELVCVYMFFFFFFSRRWFLVFFPWFGEGGP